MEMKNGVVAARGWGEGKGLQMSKFQSSVYPIVT